MRLNAAPGSLIFRPPAPSTPRWRRFPEDHGPRLNGANPPRRGDEADSETHMESSGYPEDLTRLAADPGSLIFRTSAPIMARLRRIQADQAYHRVRRKPAAMDPCARFLDSHVCVCGGLEISCTPYAESHISHTRPKKKKISSNSGRSGGIGVNGADSTRRGTDGVPEIQRGEFEIS